MDLECAGRHMKRQYLVGYFLYIYIHRQWAGYWKNPTATGCCRGCNTSSLSSLCMVSLSIYICWLFTSVRVLNSIRCWALIFYGFAILHILRPNTKQPLAALSSTAMSTKNFWTDTEAASGSQLHLLVRQWASIKAGNAVREGRDWMGLKLPCLHYVNIHSILEHFSGYENLPVPLLMRKLIS